MMAETQTPWGLAEREGKTIIARVFGPMVGVYYPYRKTGDLYVAVKEHPVRCCQCDQDVPDDEFLKHVTSHNRLKRKHPDFIIDPSLVEPADGAAHHSSEKASENIE